MLERFKKWRVARDFRIGVGDRVRDPLGNEHTFPAIYPKAEHGMGVIRTRRDDGTELDHAMIAHGLTPVTK